MQKRRVVVVKHDDGFDAEVLVQGSAEPLQEILDVGYRGLFAEVGKETAEGVADKGAFGEAGMLFEQTQKVASDDGELLFERSARPIGKTQGKNRIPAGGGTGFVILPDGKSGKEVFLIRISQREEAFQGIRDEGFSKTVRPQQKGDARLRRRHQSRMNLVLST